MQAPARERDPNILSEISVPGTRCLDKVMVCPERWIIFNLNTNEARYCFRREGGKNKDEGTARIRATRGGKGGAKRRDQGRPKGEPRDQEGPTCTKKGDPQGVSLALSNFELLVRGLP